MTEKELKEAIHRGLGRGILAVEREPERFREQVLWACRHSLAYDTQCEGSRAWYVYRMICCYPDPQPFVEETAQCLRKRRSNGGWDIFYYSELLSYFAVDGNKTARKALREKYRELYAALMARKRAKSGVFPERDDFDNLCVVLAMTQKSFLRIAEDMGRLFREKPFYDAWGFGWFCSEKGRKYSRILKRAAKDNENMAAFYAAYQEQEKERREWRGSEPPADRKGRLLSLWLARRADAQTVLEYARAYAEQEDPEKRAEALIAFSRCPYPEDPAPLILDAQSSCEPLQKAAWEALENVRHSDVRQLALTHIGREEAIPVLVTNYQPEDEALLTGLVKAVPLVDTENRAVWHGIHMDVLRMQDDGLKEPKELLPYIYETTLCSCCRFNALRRMGKRRMLTEELLRECLYDSNDDIRTYAKQALTRRKKEI